MIAVHVEISSEATSAPILDINSYSKIESLLRVTVRVFRFIERCRLKTTMHTGFLVAKEIAEAENYWIRHVQQ